eukprot:gene24061-biopygen1319
MRDQPEHMAVMPRGFPVSCTRLTRADGATPEPTDYRSVQPVGKQIRCANSGATPLFEAVPQEHTPENPTQLIPATQPSINQLCMFPPFKQAACAMLTRRSLHGTAISTKAGGLPSSAGSVV